MFPSNLSLGAGSGLKFKTVAMPQSANIIRAWSLRRLIANYKKGLATKIDRADPIPEGAEPIYFNRFSLI